MFNNSYIGQKVISKYWGIGVISIFIDSPNVTIPVGVMFNKYKFNHNPETGLKEHADAYFHADGSCCINSNTPDYSIAMYEPVDLLQEEDND